MTASRFRLAIREGESVAEAGGYLREKTLLPGQGHEPRGHDCAIVTLVVDGRLDEDFAGRRQTCSSFELHYKPPGAVHATATGPEGVRMLLLGLDKRLLTDLGVEAIDEPRTLAGGISAARALGTLLALADGTGRVGPAEAGALRRLWEDLAAGLVSRPRERPSWISEVHERARCVSGRSVGLGSLAREFGVHPVYLARVFRRHFQTTIGAVRSRTRIERAVATLRAGKTDLVDLALDLGYSDQSHFSREFKKATGWSPGRFRRRCRALGRRPASPGGLK